MSLSVAIMAHPSRFALVEELSKRLPGARVVWDAKGDRWDTGRRSMLAFDPRADWHLVVQDDAILCRDFVATVGVALLHVTTGPAAFYMGRSSINGIPTQTLVRTCVAQRKRWVRGNGPLWGPAVAVRTNEIPAMIAWGDVNTEIANYDLRMAAYWSSLKRCCWYSVPSLVDHRVGPGVPSLVEGRGHTRGRTAVSFLGNRRVNWNDRSLYLGLAMRR